MNYRDLYEWGRQELTAAGIGESDLDARLLLEHICHTDRNTLLAHPDREVGKEEQEEYRRMIGLRASRIPLQHLTGVQEFMGLEFQVNEKVLIPRQDTETLVEEAMRFLQDGDRILDVCTGSGCILLSLLHYSNHCRGVGVDLSREAIEVARENGRRIGAMDRPVPWEADSLTWLWSDLFSVFSGETVSKEAEGIDGAAERKEEKFDLIVSNPPYIATTVIETLMEEVRDHEPRMALDGKEDGLFFYRRIVADSREYLVKEGRLFLEIGYDQAEEVRKLMEEAGYEEVTVVKDLGGNDRVVHGVWYGRNLEENHV